MDLATKFCSTYKWRLPLLHLPWSSLKTLSWRKRKPNPTKKNKILFTKSNTLNGISKENHLSLLSNYFGENLLSRDEADFASLENISVSQNLGPGAYCRDRCILRALTAGHWEVTEVVWEIAMGAWIPFGTLTSMENSVTGMQPLSRTTDL